MIIVMDLYSLCIVGWHIDKNETGFFGHGINPIAKKYNKYRKASGENEQPALFK